MLRDALNHGSACSCHSSILFDCLLPPSSTPQADLGNLTLQALGRFIRPASLHPDGPEAAELLSAVLQMSRPGALRATWRYTVMANVLSIMLMPHPGNKVGSDVAPVVSPRVNEQTFGVGASSRSV